MGDETEALYREHGAAVAAFCGSLLRDRAEAEDAAQQVFLSAHRALLNGSAPREPLAWLLTVARHECYARFRQRATVAVPTGDVPDGAAADASVHVLRAGELATMWDEVGRMPAAQREAFLLREVRGLSYGQLADQLSLSPPSVRSLLLRARTRLRHRLRDVAAGFGGAPWIQALVRLAAGDGASPVPAATKAAAVGLGALALVGGADVAPAPHHVSKPPARSAAHRRAEARLRHVAEPAAAAPAEDPGSDGRSSTSRHARDRGGSRSRRGSDDRVSSSASSSGESSSDGGDDHGSTTTVVAQPTTDGRDGHDGDRSPSAGSGSDGGSGSSGSDRSGSPQGSGSGDGGSDGGSGGSGTGSDGGPDGGSGSGPGG